MASGLIEIMKMASMNAMDNAQMSDLRFGTVTSTNPLKVQVSTQFTIPESLLIVPMHLRDYKVKVNFDWDTETDGGNHSHEYTDAPATGVFPTTQTNSTKHHHQIKSENNNNQTKTITILSGLRKDDKVALLRKQGGQCYYILDRVDSGKGVEEVK